MPTLGVNIDHVATLRQARGGREPDPIGAAVLVELAGADGIVVHLREDRRHIQDRDLILLKETVQTKLNLEMATDEKIVKIALKVKPDLITLVPERRQELTTEGGLDVSKHRKRIEVLINQFHDHGIRVSLFIDPDLKQVRAANNMKADSIELHTGPYAHASGFKEEEAEFESLLLAAQLGLQLGLGINAGHGLNYQNVKRLRQIPEIAEFNIGHSIMARSIFVGLGRAVREMKELVSSSFPSQC
jgi:pyridoxine 5-phosphate synthase